MYNNATNDCNAYDKENEEKPIKTFNVICKP